MTQTTHGPATSGNAPPITGNHAFPAACAIAQTSTLRPAPKYIHAKITDHGTVSRVSTSCIG